MDRAEFKNAYKNASENLDVAETLKFLTTKYKNENIVRGGWLGRLFCIGN